MKEKSIIFNTQDVRAILNTKPGTWPVEPIDHNKPFKWQARRVIKPQPHFEEWYLARNLTVSEEYMKNTPYKKGDLLWVRETWRCSCVGSAGNSETAFIEYKDGDVMFIDIDHKQSFYFAGKARWKPSIHMPREASRILLEVKGVRVERLWGIREDDAQAEGMEALGIFTDLDGNENVCVGMTYKEPFCQLWDRLNAKRGYSWESNPWVWVYEFMRVK
jgi:hypothetical protein